MAVPHIKESHKGLLHEALGVKADKEISAGSLMVAKSRAKRTGNTKLVAENARKWHHA